MRDPLMVGEMTLREMIVTMLKTVGSKWQFVQLPAILFDENDQLKGAFYTPNRHEYGHLL